MNTEKTFIRPENGFELEAVCKKYRRGQEVVHIFQGLDMRIEKGEFVAIMGPSGSGKTTFLNLLSGIDAPDSGQILFQGLDLTMLNKTEQARWRSRHVGFVFQSYNLLPVLSAGGNIELPLMLAGLSTVKRRELVHMALDLVGLRAHLHRMPSQLSGGEQQRVAIARAIVANTSVLMCDEPTGNLDRRASEEILQTLSVLNERMGKTIIMVTHDPHAAGYARRCCVLDKGQFIDGVMT